MKIIVIGNGPSMRDFDWTQIAEDDITIGCNFIYRSGYVPNIICFTDTKYIWENHKDEVLNLTREDGSKPILVFQRNENYAEMSHDKYAENKIVLMLFVDMKLDENKNETVWADFSIKEDKTLNIKQRELEVSDKQESEDYKNFKIKEVSFKDYLINFYSCGKFNTMHIPETGNSMTNLCIPWALQICQSLKLDKIYMIGVDATFTGHFYDRGDDKMQITYLKEKVYDYYEVLSELFNINLVNCNSKSALIIPYAKIFNEF